MVSEADIYRSAQVMRREHGNAAIELAQAHANKHWDAGDDQGAPAPNGRPTCVLRVGLIERSYIAIRDLMHKETDQFSRQSSRVSILPYRHP